MVACKKKKEKNKEQIKELRDTNPSQKFLLKKTLLFNFYFTFFFKKKKGKNIENRDNLT